MASSEARGPLGMFVGFLLVALGVTLYKPQSKPQPDASPAKSQTEARNSSGLPMAAVPAAPGEPAAIPPAPDQPAPAQPKIGPSAADKPNPPVVAGDTTKATASAPAPAPPSAPTPDEALRPRDQAKLDQAKLDPSPVAPSSPASASPTAPAGDAPHFDVVRVEPSGDAVVAGKGAPDSKVELLGQGKVIAEARTDAAGNFVILPPTLAPGSYDLSLRQAKPGKAPAESTQSVAVAVPRKGGKVVVALAEPGKPTKVLSAPPPPVAAPSAPPAAPPAPAGTAATDRDVAIRSVELENGNGFFASGAAKPGSAVHIYLNGAHIADVVTAADGQWSVTLKKGLKGGHYVVRADVGGSGGAKVVARVEVPFDVPVAMAEAPPAAPPAGPSAAPPASAASNAKAEAPSAAPASPPQTSTTSSTSSKTSGDVSASKPAQQANGQADRPAGSTASAGQAASARPEAGASNAIIAEIDTAVVVPGDNLWNISRARLGHGRRFTQIYAANTSQIRDPSLIYPGQVLVVPPH